MRPIHLRKIVLLAATLSITTPSAALASEPGRTWRVGNASYHLYLDDLDLQSRAGRAEALARAERAAGKLCREGTRAARRDCVSTTVRTSTTGSAQGALQLALEERAAVQLAATR